MPGDREARYSAVVGELVEPLRRFLARRVADPADAEDVLAEVLLVLWRRFDALPTEPLPYAYGVARLQLANHERAARRQRRVAGKISVIDPPRHAPEPAPGDDEVAEALAALRADDAEVLRLWAWEQLTPAEIATVLDTTSNAASIRLHRAKKKLAEEIGKIRSAAGHEGAEGSQA